MHFARASTIVLLTLLGGLGLTTGCGSTGADYSRVELIRVSGQVTLDGQPLAGAVITFEGQDGQFSYGQTDSAGRYTLQFDSEKQGVTPGPKIVRISTTRKIPGLGSVESGEAGEAASEEAAPGPAATELVPARYNRDSELKVDVPRKDPFDFALTTR